jgi:hypothetical protein
MGINEYFRGSPRMVSSTKSDGFVYCSLGCFSVIVAHVLGSRSRDGPVLPKEASPHAEMGSEILERTYAQGYASVHESKISGRSGRAEGQISVAVVRSGPASIVSKDSRTVPTR